MRTRHAGTTRSPGLNVKKQTVAFLSLVEIVVVHWMNYHHPPCSGSTLISGGLFAKTGRKKPERVKR